jgi:predicted ATPase/DNA-binding CsgD family transcriptional regulator
MLDYKQRLGGNSMPLTVMRPLGALPAEVTGFVGRRPELAQLTELLGTARLVTVTGPGGVGKTRVCLRAADRLADAFGDGVCLAELSGLTDPELLPHTVATCLGLPERDARSQLDALLGYLRDRRVLLILDTCEHLLDACAMLADVLLRETLVTVLVTSRQPLDVPGEHLCPISPLPDGDAVELFAQRAAEVVPGFAVTDTNRRDVTRLCQRLEGIPLAIELASVRLRALPLPRLADRLEGHFRLLSSGRRTGPVRHSTLRAAIGWSHDQCSPAERLLWRRLSVFAGTFSVMGAEEVCADQELPPEEILETLIGLVDKSVVLRADDGAGYRMLDTIREFGAELLAEAEEEVDLRDRHIRRYAEQARYFGQHLIADDQVLRFHELRVEHANIRAALEYALASPDGDLDAAAIATYLYGYWELSGLHREGRHWLARVLERFPAPCAQRAWALAVGGLLGTFQGEAARAAADLEEAIAVAGQIGAEQAVVRSQVFLQLALTFGGEHQRALEVSARAEESLGGVDDLAAELCLAAGTGYAHLLTGDPVRAVERCERGLSLLAGRTGERWLQSWLYLVIGFAHLIQEHDAAAHAAASTALTMKHELGDVVGTAHCLDGIGWLAAKRGRGARAAWLFGAAAPLWEVTGAPMSGDLVLQAFHDEAEARARETLGDESYEALSRVGAASPLDRVISAAIGNADDLPRASSGHSRGDTLLTSREREIAALVSQGLSNREIAQRLVISKRTVDAHVEHIYAKLGVSSRVQLTRVIRE